MPFSRHEMKRIVVLLFSGDDRAAYLARHHVISYQDKRAEVYRWYGAACVCCGETHPAMLTLDHINGDGHGERNEKSVKAMWRDYKLHERYQLLCLNCN